MGYTICQSIFVLSVRGSQGDVVWLGELLKFPDIWVLKIKEKMIVSLRKTFATPNARELKMYSFWSRTKEMQKTTRDQNVQSCKIRKDTFG